MNPMPRSNRFFNTLCLLLLFLSGASLVLVYGRMGFMALDDSIVFDGGWRILSGQLPLRDFYAPNGFVPMWMQALFFQLGGVHWWSFLVHAALLNGLFAVMVCMFLRKVGASMALALYYGLLSSLLLYVPVGNPYMEQHAFFFGFWAVFQLWIACRSRISWVRKISFFAVAVLLGLAYLSKQIPSTFMLLPMAWIVLAARRGSLLEALQWLFTGALFFVSLVLIYLWRIEVNWQELIYYTYELPSGTGQDRVLARLSTMKSPFALPPMLMGMNSYNLFTYFIYGFTLVTGLRWLLSSVFQNFNPNTAKPCVHSKHWLTIWFLRPSQRVFRHGILLWLGMTLMWVCMLFMSLSKNEFVNGMPYFFMAYALVHLSLARMVRPSNPGHLTRRWKLYLVLPGLMLLLAGVDAWRFHEKVNLTRKVDNIEFGSQPVVGFAGNSPLHPMLFQVPDNFQFKAQDLLDVMEFLRNNPGNFWLVGDTSILYGMTGKPSINPVLWYHPGLTVPPYESTHFKVYQDRLIARLEQYEVKFVVVEGTGSSMGPALQEFGRVHHWLQNNRCDQFEMGGYTIIELCQNR